MWRVCVCVCVCARAHACVYAVCMRGRACVVHDKGVFATPFTRGFIVRGPEGGALRCVCVCAHVCV